MVGAAGFEPTMAVPKTAALPLGYAPIFCYNKTIYLAEVTLRQAQCDTETNRRH